MGAVIAAYLVLWLPLILAGWWLGKAWGNPLPGWFLPALLGPLGFAVFAAGSHPALQPERVKQQRIGG